MGCWNETCMLSNLPIIYGEKIKLVILKGFRKSSLLVGNSYCNSIDLFSPIGFPISGEYNDYGNIEEVNNDWNYKLIEQYLKLQFGDTIDVEDEVIPKWKLEDFLYGIERGSLKTFNKNNGWDKCHYCFVMIREDIWNACKTIQETNESSFYRNSKKNSNNIDDDTISFYVTGKEFLEEAFVKEVKYLSEPFDINKIFFHHQSILTYSRSNTSLPITNYISFLRENIENQKVINNFYKQWSEFILINDFLQTCRKGWMPQAGAGSQNADWEIHKKLSEEIIKVCDQKIEEYED